MPRTTRERCLDPTAGSDERRDRVVTAVLGFKGHKASLPRKVCVACGREMVWRRAWAKNWDLVRYCSDACRRGKGRDGR